MKGGVKEKQSRERRENKGTLRTMGDCVYGFAVALCLM